MAIIEHAFLRNALPHYDNQQDLLDRLICTILQDIYCREDITGVLRGAALRRARRETRGGPAQCTLRSHIGHGWS